MAIEQEEPQEFGSTINLSRVDFSWWTPLQIDRWLDDARTDLADGDAWKQKHRERIAAYLKRPNAMWHNADELLAASRQRLADTPEAPKRLAGISENIRPITEQVQRRLGAWLPDWVAADTHVQLGLFERSDYRIDHEHIFVDQLRLSQAPDPGEDLTMGMTHELVHRWMSQMKTAAQTTPREQFHRKLINEGLAMFVAGQNLSEQRVHRGKDWPAYQAESTARIKSLLADPGLTVDQYEPEFYNMAAGYVAGEAIIREARSILGDDGLRTAIVEAPNQPGKIIEATSFNIRPVSQDAKRPGPGDQVESGK